jgi:hypothetical protein
MRKTTWTMLAALAMGILAPYTMAVAQVEPRVVPGAFPGNGAWEMGGGIFPVTSGPGVVYNVVKGPVTFDLNWHFQYTGGVLNTVDTSLTVIYTIDGKPISPRIKTPYTWTWDSTTVPDGSHVVGVILVDGVWNGTTPGNGYVPNASVVTVDNVPGPVLGNQMLASLGTGAIRVSQKTAIPEWIPWSTGYTLPHPTKTVPYVAPVAPTAASLNLPDAGLASIGFIAEPVTQANVSLESTSLRIVRDKPGHLYFEPYFVEKTNSADPSLPGVLAEPLMDGPRNDNQVSPYSTYVPDPVGRGFVGVDLGGRVFRLDMDGSVVTLVGRQVKRDVVPYSVTDPRVTEADRRAWQINMIGDFHGTEFHQPNDLAFDPRSNGKILYVADTENHRIARVDLAVSPPSITTYAGNPSTEGDIDGPALSALMHGPSSLVVTDDGTMYVADYDNNNIRRIAPNGGAVTTIASGLNQPFAIRFDSKGNLIILELIDSVLKKVDLANNNAVSTIFNAQCNFGWTWLAVDRTGSIGPVDDMFITCQKQEFIGWRVSADGTRVINSPMQFGHYPWAVAIRPDEGRILLHGFGDTAPTSYRVPAVGDPPPDPSGWYTRNEVWLVLNRIGNIVNIWGTIPEFPFNAYAAKAAIRGYGGYSPLYGFQSYDDIATMTWEQIGAWVNAGMGGSAPHPEIVGRDRDLVVEDILQRSAGFPNKIYPLLPAAPTDITPPVISDVVMTPVDGTTVKVSWKTDKPTLGYVRFGTVVPNYFRWSTIETGFGLVHTVLLEYLPDNANVHYMVVVEDQTPNFSGTPDHVFATGSPPPPPPPLLLPTATLTAVPSALTAGQTSLLTWKSTNASACVGSGFTAGGPSGFSQVVPQITTIYSVTCSGSGGTSLPVKATVTVNPAPPPVIKVGTIVKATKSAAPLTLPKVGKMICTQKPNTKGTIFDGPQTIDDVTWWWVDFVQNCDGWVRESDVTK